MEPLFLYSIHLRFVADSILLSKQKFFMTAFRFLNPYNGLQRSEISLNHGNHGKHTISGTRV